MHPLRTTGYVYLFILITSHLLVADIEKKSEKTPRLSRLWLSTGPAWVNSSDSHTSVRLAGGGEFFATETLSIGGYLTKVFVTEPYSTSNFLSGTIQEGTFSTFTLFAPAIAFHFIPHYLWMRAAYGLTYIHNSSPNGISDRLNNSLSATLGGTVYRTSSFGFGLEAGYEFRGGNSIFNGFSEALGNYPYANIYSISAVFDFLP